MFRVVLDNYSEGVLQLAREKGLLCLIGLVNARLPLIYLTRLTNSSQLERTSRGLYRLPERPLSNHESMVLIATRVPQAVFCPLTALHFHDLNHSSTPRDLDCNAARKPCAPVRTSTSEDDPVLRLRIRTRNRGVRKSTNSIRIYGTAKTMLDCFEHRNKSRLDVALEALKNVWSRQVTADALWDNAGQTRVANVMRPYLEAVT